MPTNPPNTPDGPEDEHLQWGPELREFGKNLASLIRTKLRGSIPQVLPRTRTPIRRPTPPRLREGGYPSMQRVPPDQLESLKARIEVHGSPVKVPRRGNEGEGLITIGSLDADFLYGVNLHPTRAVVADGIPFLLSDPYEHQGRLCVVAYVGDAQGEAYVARTYYLSGSHGTWRHLPGYSAYDGHFDKFTGEDQIALPGMVQWALGAISQPDKPRVSIPETRDRDMAFYGTAREEVAMAQMAMEEADRTIHRDLVGGRVTELDDGEAEAEKTPRELNEALDLKRETKECYPDVHHVLDHWEQYSPTYQRNIRVELVPDLFVEGITYHFHSMDYELDGKVRTAVWLGNGEDVHGRIGSTGLRKGYVKIGNLGAAPYEYHSQAGSYTEGDNHMGRYVGIHRDYHDRITLFQEYRQALEVRRKGTLRGNAAFIASSLKGRPIRDLPQALTEAWSAVELPGLADFVGRNRTALKFTLAGILTLGTVMERGHAPYRHEVVFRPGGETLYGISERILRNLRRRNPELARRAEGSYLVRDLMRRAVINTILKDNARAMREQGQENLNDDRTNIRAGLRIRVNFHPDHYYANLARAVEEVDAALMASAEDNMLDNQSFDRLQLQRMFANVNTARIDPRNRELVEAVISGRLSYLDPEDERIGRQRIADDVASMVQTKVNDGKALRIVMEYAHPASVPVLARRPRPAAPETFDIVQDIDAGASARKAMDRIRYVTLHSTISPPAPPPPPDPKPGARIVTPADKSAAVKADLKRKAHAHFFIARDGSIHQLFPVTTALNHAGLFSNEDYGAIYKGDGAVTMQSIGVEVEADEREPWNAAQKLAARNLLSYLSQLEECRELRKQDVKRHAEIANAKAKKEDEYGWVGRKSDPFGVDFSELGLPKGAALNLDIIAGRLEYASAVDRSADHEYGRSVVALAWKKSQELYAAIHKANPRHGDVYRQPKPKTEMGAPGNAAPTRTKPVPAPQKPSSGKKSPSGKAAPTKKGRQPSRQSTTPQKKPAPKAPAKKRNRR